VPGYLFHSMSYNSTFPFLRSHSSRGMLYCLSIISL